VSTFFISSASFPAAAALVIASRDFSLSLSRLKAINQSPAIVASCVLLRQRAQETSCSVRNERRAVAIQFFDCNLIKTQFAGVPRCWSVRWVSTIIENSCVPPKLLYRQEPKFGNL
jgi:hypothetical protein